MPSGTLAQTPDVDRIASISAGFIVFFMCKRNIFAGTGSAFVTFLGFAAARNYGLL